MFCKIYSVRFWAKRLMIRPTVFGCDIDCRCARMKGGSSNFIPEKYQRRQDNYCLLT